MGINKKNLEGSKILKGLDRVAANRGVGFKAIQSSGVGRVGRLCPRCGFATVNSHLTCTNCGHQREH